MKHRCLPSQSTDRYETNNEPKEPHLWPQKDYQEKRERTVRLAKATVDQLVKEKQTVTIEAICRKSVEIDPEGQGAKKSALLENPEAHTYYRQHKHANGRARHMPRQRNRSALIPTAMWIGHAIVTCI
jgi:hypothetical protein